MPIPVQDDTQSSAQPVAQPDAGQGVTPATPGAPPAAPAAPGAAGAPNASPQPMAPGQGAAAPTQAPAPTAAQVKAVTLATKSPNPVAQHVHDIAETLSGGGRYTTTYDDAGNPTRHKVPVSTAHLGLAFAMEVLRGGLAGVSGDPKEAAARGMNEGDKQLAAKQKAQQDQNNRDSADQARKQSITETNLKLHQAAMNVGKADEETNRKMDATFKPVMDDLERNHPQAILDKVPEWSLQDALKKYNVTKEMAIPYDTIAVNDPKTGEQAKHADGSPVWGHMYAIVDPSIKTTLSDETQTMGYNVGEFRDADGNKAQIGTPSNWPLKDIISRHTKYAQIQVAEGLLNKQIGQMKGESPDGEGWNVSIADQIRKDPSLMSAVEDYSKFAGVGGLDQVIYTMGQSQDPTDRQSAARIMQLAGISADDLESKHNERIAAAKKAQEKPIEPDTDDKARMIANNPTETPARRKLAQAVLDAKSEEQKKLKLDELNNTRAISGSDIDRAAKTLVDDPNNIASLQGISSMRSDERLRLFNSATDYAKQKGVQFDASAPQRKAKMLDSYENGKQADQIQSYQTFLKHDADLYTALQNFGRPGYTPKWIDKPLNWLEQNVESDPEIGAYLAKVQPVRDEIQTFLKNNHAPLSQDIDEMSKIVDANQSPRYLQAVAKSLAQTGMFRLDSVNSRFKHEFKKDFDGLYDDESSAALKTLGVQPLHTAPPAAVVSKLKEGVNTTFANGQTWTLRGGKPTQVDGK